MPDESTLETNADRLLIHLKPESLAARIVAAYAGAAGESRKTAVERIIRDHLADIAGGYNEDQ